MDELDLEGVEAGLEDLPRERIMGVKLGEERRAVVMEWPRPGEEPPAIATIFFAILTSWMDFCSLG